MHTNVHRAWQSFCFSQGKIFLLNSLTGSYDCMFLCLLEYDGVKGALCLGQMTMLSSDSATGQIREALWGSVCSSAKWGDNNTCSLFLSRLLKAEITYAEIFFYVRYYYVSIYFAMIHDGNSQR